MKGLKYSLPEEEIDKLAEEKNLFSLTVFYDGDKTFHIKENDAILEGILKFKSGQLDREVYLIQFNIMALKIFFRNDQFIVILVHFQVFRPLKL